MAKEFAKSFYKSPEWARVRKYVLMRDKYKCQKCGKPAQEVHHKEHLSPENIWDVRITLNPMNLQSLCRDCHFAQHIEDKAAGLAKLRHKDCDDGYMFDESGQLVPVPDGGH